MAEYSVEEAGAGDFEGVLPLLRQLGADHITDERWKRIFERHWAGAHNHFGYVLRRGGEIEGFLGAIFSRRTIDGVSFKFCNMTSWIVQPGARGASLQLLAPLLKLADHTITNFTPSQSVARVLAAMRFTEIQREQVVLFAMPSMKRPPRGWRMTMEVDDIANRVGESDALILSDHGGFECHHLLMESDAGYCYVVLKLMRRGRLTFARPHYVSDPALFDQYIDHARLRIALSLRVAGLIVEDHYLASHKAHSRRLPPDSRWFVRRASTAPAHIDTLYSEMILLHA